MFGKIYMNQRQMPFTTGLAQNSIENGTLEVFPNPAKDANWMKVPSMEYKNLLIPDLSGKLVMIKFFKMPVDTKM